MALVTSRPFAQPKPASSAGFFRRVVVPIGLLALIAIGVHAAADTVDDRVLWLVDRADSALDAIFGAWKVTEPLVNLVGIEQRTLIARAFTLAWELTADVLLVVPLFRYREGSIAPEEPQRWKAWLRALRALPAVPIALAGACATARMVQGALLLSLQRGAAGEEFAGPFARLVAIALLLAVCATFGWRAIRISALHARARSTGLVPTLLLLPISLAALVDAAPVLSFFR
jgi:hypothetical protein